MPSFQSNEERFRAVDDLIVTLELGGRQQAADELTDDYRCLNGLTDGEALFLAAVERVQATRFDRFDGQDRQAARGDPGGRSQGRVPALTRTGSAHRPVAAARRGGPRESADAPRGSGPAGPLLRS